MTDEGWFARLYEHGFGALVLTAYALTNDLDEAVAVTQEAFVIAYGRQPRLAGSPEDSVRAIVLRLARRRRAGWYRGRRRAEPAEAIRALPDEQRVVVVLHYLADLSADEIASIVDTPVDTVTSRLSRARTALAMRELTESRAALLAAVEPPGLPDVADRAARRRTRTRMLVTAAAAVVAVGVAVPLLRGPDQDRPVLPASDLPRTPSVTALDFADETHGYALRYACPDGTAASCTGELLATSDGRTWRALPVPALTSWGLDVHLFVLGPAEVVIERAAPAARVHSTDGGRTWRRVDVAAARTVARIPDGARLRDGCPEHCGVGVVLPGSATTARLSTLPAFENTQVGADRRGAWWIVGRDPRRDRWLAAFSADGRAWVTGDLGPADAVLDWRFASTGSTTYAVAIGADAVLVGIFLSTDGGHTWARVERGAEAQPTTVMGYPVIAGDGLLVKSDGGVTFLSSDGGHTFRIIGQRFPGDVRPTPHGYLAFDFLAQRFAISSDGVSWRELSIPD